MHYTYILQSLQNPSKFHIGQTSNLKKRLEEHNSGQSIHTNKHKPWKLKTYTVFEEKQQSLNFEKYLKSGSGRKFSKKFL